MTIKELKELIDIVTSQASIEELEIEKSGVRLRIKRASSTATTGATAPVPAPAMAAVLIPAPAVPETDHLHYVKSPMVGTFYASPNPTSDPYISPGDSVQKGTVLCIIEAMKLMNEIESEVAGEIVSVLVKSGQPVEYGEKLFSVRPR